MHDNTQRIADALDLVAAILNEGYSAEAIELIEFSEYALLCERLSSNSQKTDDSTIITV
jgi:hypothetical protein